MTHIETSRVNEALELQIASIRDQAGVLSSADLESLEGSLSELEEAVAELKSLLEALPHRHAEHRGTDRRPAASPSTSGISLDKGPAVASDPTAR